MGKYNKPKEVTVTPTVVNHQGGTGYALATKLELVSLLATGIQTTFYEKEGDRESRLRILIEEVAKKDSTFVAKALVYARTKMGQRTVTHLGAVNVAKFLSGTDLGKRFYSKRDRKAETGGIIFRLDDMLEIAACYLAKNPGNKKKDGTLTVKFPNSIKKGFKIALEGADKYELAKYQGKGKEISLVDIVNLVHPKPRKEMLDTFKELMNGELKQFNTVEDKNTRTGQEVAKKVAAGTITKAEAEIELKESKTENYAELIKTRKIGYLALLRNLRNILKNASDNKTLVTAAAALLTDPALIKQSLVFPHQIDLALEIMLAEFSNSEMSIFAKALNTAYELAIPNLSELGMYGNSAVVWDTSASMTSVKVSLSLNANSRNASAADKAALIGATLAKGIGADLYHFASYCEPISFNINDSVNTIKNKGLSMTGKVGHGTSFDAIFSKLASKKYDRIFIISDMQGGDSLGNGSSYSTYIKKYGQPHIYSIDIMGYGTTMIKPGQKIYNIFGYSSEIYELCKKVEIDPKALLKEIDAIVI